MAVSLVSWEGAQGSVEAASICCVVTALGLVVPLALSSEPSADPLASALTQHVTGAHLGTPNPQNGSPYSSHSTATLAPARFRHC